MTQTTPSHSQAVEAAERNQPSSMTRMEFEQALTDEAERAALCNSMPEINFNNYNIDDVHRLQQWAFEAATCLQELTSQQEVAAPVGDAQLWMVAQEAFTETDDKIESIKDAWQRVVDRVLAASRVPVASLAEPANYDKQEIDLLVHRITGQDTAEDSIDALQNAVRILDGKTIAAVVDELYDAAQATTGSGQDSGSVHSGSGECGNVHAPGPTDAEHHGLDNDKQVLFYEQDFYVLSNFSSFNVKWRGRTFMTSEHAYHWAKFFDHPDAMNGAGSLASQVMLAPSAHEAFKIGETYKARRRSDWDEVKVGFMREIITAKAEQNEYVRRKLLATGDRELIENSWRDDYWGWGPNRDGQNMLGKLWMEVRAAILSTASPAGEGEVKP